MSIYDNISITSSDDDINLSELKKRNMNTEDKNYYVVCNEHYVQVYVCV